MLALGLALLHGVPACVDDGGDGNESLNPQPLPPFSEDDGRGNAGSSSGGSSSGSVTSPETGADGGSDGGSDT